MRLVIYSGAAKVLVAIAVMDRFPHAVKEPGISAQPNHSHLPLVRVSANVERGKYWVHKPRAVDASNRT
jgi:hypothetical protein